MRGYTFGVVKGYANPPAFDAAAFLNKVTADSEKKVSDFNAGLAIRIEDGVVERLKHRYGF